MRNPLCILVGFAAVVIGATGGAQTLTLRDIENPGLTPGTLFVDMTTYEPLSAYATHTSPVTGLTEPVYEPVTELTLFSPTYAAGGLAPARSPWTATISSAPENGVGFSIGATGPGAAIGVFYQKHDENGEPIDELGYFASTYSLYFEVRAPLQDVLSNGRTGVAARATSIVANINYAIPEYSGDVYLALGSGSTLSDADLAALNAKPADGSRVFTLAGSNSFAPSTFLYGETVAEGLLLSGAFTLMQRGDSRGIDPPALSDLSFSGTIHFTYALANPQAEFIYRGRSIVAVGDFQDYNNWSQLMTPGISDVVRFSQSGTTSLSLTQNEVNRAVVVSGGGTTDFAFKPYTAGPPVQWEVGRDFEAEETPALSIESGTFRLHGSGRLSLIGDAVLAPNAADESVLDIGAGSTLAFSGRQGGEAFLSSSLVIGRAGQGSMTVHDGGRVLAEDVSMGFSAGSSGALTVTGSGTRFDAAGVVVGANGRGTLTLQGGARMAVGNIEVGTGAGADGLVTVTGAGSVLEVQSVGSIGARGLARVSVVAGGALQGDTDQGPAIPFVVGGVEPGHSASLTVSGSGSRLANLGLVVRNGGQLVLRDNAVWQGTGVNVNQLEVRGGTALIERGATATVESVVIGGAYTAVGPAGTRDLISAGIVGVTGLSSLTVTDTLTVQQGGSITVSGAGAQVTVADSVLIGGRVSVSDGGILRGGRIVVFDGGIIQGNNGVIGPRFDGETLDVLIEAGGSANPGNSPGRLTINGNLTLLDGARLQLEIGGTEGGVSYDQLLVSGRTTFSAGANIEFAFTNGFAPVTGQTFAFFDTANGFDFTEGSVTFGFTGLADGWTYEAGLVNGVFALTSLSDGVATTSAIPEPSTWAAWGGVAALGLAVYRRRRG